MEEARFCTNPQVFLLFPGTSAVCCGFYESPQLPNNAISRVSRISTNLKNVCENLRSGPVSPCGFFD